MRIRCGLPVLLVWSVCVVVGSGAWAEGKASVFSGAVTEFKDTYNGYKLKVPVEFKQTSKGATNGWVGPLLNGTAVSFSVNCVEMPNVSSQVMYDINFKQKKRDRFYVDVKPVIIKFGDKTVKGFVCKEASHIRGGRARKQPEDLHRWHLFVYGNGRAYTCGFSANFKSFQQGLVQDVFRKIIKSFELIPIKE